jgi:hypothetical protein
MVRELRTAIWGLVLAAVAVGGPTAARACFVGDQFNTYNRDRTRYVHCVCKGSDVFGESQCHMH